LVLKVTIWFYVKTTDEPKTVGNAVCAANAFQGKHPEDQYTWIMQDGRDEPGYWEIRGKYAGLKDLTEIGIVYRIGDTVVLSEIDNNLSPNFVDPLMEKYGFDNVKWIVVPTIS
jgi:hypothetical protein